MNVLFAQRLQTGPVTLRQIGSVLDLVIIEHADVFTLREATRQSGASISAAFNGSGWGCDEILCWEVGLNRNRGRHVLDSSTTAAWCMHAYTSCSWQPCLEASRYQRYYDVS